MAKSCAGTRKDGSPCRATPRGDTGYCNAHSAKEVRESSGFGGSQPGAGRPRVPRITDRMRERVEEEVEAILAPYFDAVKHAVMHATHEGEVIVSQVPDLGARINAAEKLLDRVYGKPTSSVDVSSTVDVNLNLVTDHDLRERAADLRRRLAATRAVQPSRADARD